MKKYIKTIMLSVVALLCISSHSLSQQQFRVPLDNNTVYDACCGFGPGQYCATRVGSPCVSDASSKHHNGKDYTATGNYNVYASNSGRVVYTNTDANAGHGMGRLIVIEHLLDNSSELLTLYAHLSTLSVNFGDIVTKGQVIGIQGNTGTGAVHLHFETKHGFDHEADGFWGGTNATDDYRNCIANPYGTCPSSGNSTTCPGYAPTNVSQTGVGFINPDNVINSSSYEAWHPLNLQSGLNAINLQTDEEVDATVYISCNYTGTWSGRVYLELTTLDDVYLGDIDDVLINTGAATETVNFYKASLESAPGLYKLRVTYANATSYVGHTQRQLVGEDLGYYNPTEVMVTEGDCHETIYYDTFGDCNNSDWQFTSGTWSSCSSSGITKYGYLRQTDENDSYVNVDLDDPVEVEAHSYYIYEVQLELEDGGNNPRIGLEIINGKIDLRFEQTNDVRIDYGDELQFVDMPFDLVEDDIYDVKVIASPYQLLLYIDGVFIYNEILSTPIDWSDSGWFDIETNYAYAKIYEVRLRGNCLSSSFQNPNDPEVVLVTDQALPESAANIALSTRSLAESFNVQVFPNPSTGQVTWASDANTQNYLSVHSITGELIFTDILSGKVQHEFTLPGVYIWKVHTSQKDLISTNKLVILD
ncbi:peptidoglycan DD-metalloendopeptidase family protein [Patescibacteria group bacterium]|nr:peptidoglycan DD-metalloendopeptidase family protein [Patescibacteria group bacterium]